MNGAAVLERIRHADFAVPHGRVRAVSHGIIEADGPAGLLGEICSVSTADGGETLAEIVRINPTQVMLSPLDRHEVIALGAKVTARPERDRVPVGDAFEGRVVNALGQPLDGRPLRSREVLPLGGLVPRPLDREPPDAVLETGIRAIDALLPLGCGQRIGIFAASGVGKTSLIEQLARQIKADRVVLCLVGERGREVESLWQTIQAANYPQRFTVVAATSDESAALRARSVPFAVALAEYWRAQGEDVLLIVDSITRLAMALREVGLAAGSPPTVRAYTPNVFSAIPRLVERCGSLRAGGSITAIMTVLSETDDVDDPIVELMKSLLDGHILLSRTLAEQGHFPAIDVSRSVSRGGHLRMSRSQQKAASEVTAMLSAYEDARVMIESGVYRSGTNALVDRAVASRGPLMDFLKQSSDSSVDRTTGLEALERLAGGPARG